MHEWRGERPSPVEPASRATGQRTPTAKFVWVVDPPACDGRWPALLLEWQQRDGGWLARVVIGIDEMTGRPGAVAVERWLPSGQIVPAALDKYGYGGLSPGSANRPRR